MTNSNFWEDVWNNTPIGERLKKARKDRGMTQEELAKLLDTKRETILKYEKGIIKNIPTFTRAKIGKILNIPLMSLLNIQEILFMQEIINDLEQQPDTLLLYQNNFTAEQWELLKTITDKMQEQYKKSLKSARPAPDQQDQPPKEE